MSTSGGIVDVIGATGFVGRHVVARLVECGYTVRAISRRGRAGRNGATVSIRWPPTSRPVQASAPRWSAPTPVVHLVAIPREARWPVLRGGERGRRGARPRRDACGRRAADRPPLACWASPTTRAYRYLSSKWRGEQLVRESGLDWMVLRPSLLFGPGDGFFNLI